MSSDKPTRTERLDMEELRRHYNDLAALKIFVVPMPLESEVTACVSLPVFKAILDALERIPGLESALAAARKENERLQKRYDECEGDARQMSLRTIEYDDEIERLEQLLRRAVEVVIFDEIEAMLAE